MEEKWTTVIGTKNGWFDIDLKGLIQYRDLIGMFVKKNFTVQYKQTILGPLWYIINPLITTIMYTIVFGRIAGLSTDNSPMFAFYLVGNSIWTYFSICLTATSNTFISNAGIFGKVYFPRLTMPISTVIYSLANFCVMFIMSLVTVIYFRGNGANVYPNWTIIFIPFYIIQSAILGLGCGIIISSLTTKYRDLNVLVSFGIQLWMYGTPVVYSVSQVPKSFQKLFFLNPVTPIVNNFRYALLGSGTFLVEAWIYSIVVTLMILIIGVVLFSRIEKTFMDTV